MTTAISAKPPVARQVSDGSSDWATGTPNKSAYCLPVRGNFRTEHELRGLAQGSTAASEVPCFSCRTGISFRLVGWVHGGLFRGCATSGTRVVSEWDTQ